MRGRLVRGAALWGACALVVSLPVLLGKSLSAHGDLYTYVFLLPNLIPAALAEWVSGQELPHHARWVAATGGVFWALVGVLVAARSARGVKPGGIRA